MKSRPHKKLVRSLRQNANAPERSAWEALRSFRSQGFAVRRQHQIGCFIVDFAVVKAKLAVAIDGAIHELPAVAARDAVREKEIGAQGGAYCAFPPRPR